MSESKYTREQLIDALCTEYDHLCHDDFNPDIDPTLDEYRENLEKLTIDELIVETSTDEIYSLDEFMSTWS